MTRAHPQRRPDRRLPPQRDEVARHEARGPRADGGEVDVLGERHPAQEHPEQLGAVAIPGGGQGQLAVDEVGAPQPRVEGLGPRRGDDQRHARRVHRASQGLEDQRRQGWRVGGRQQHLGVGHEQHRRHRRGGVVHGLAHPGGGRAGLDRGGARPVQPHHARVGLGGHGAHERRLAHALRPADQHAEARRRAEPFEQLGAAEDEVEPLAETARGVGLPDEVGDGDHGLGGDRLDGLRDHRGPGLRPRGLRAPGLRRRGGGPRRSARARPVAPAHDRRGPDAERRGRVGARGRLGGRDGDELGGPRAAQGRREPATGARGVGARGRGEVLGQQRERVAGEQDLAGQREAQRLRGEGDGGETGAGQLDAARHGHRRGRDAHGGAVDDAGVDHRGLVEHRRARCRGRGGGGDEGGGGARARDAHGVPGLDAQGGDHLGVQADDPAARVARGGAETREEVDTVRRGHGRSSRGRSSRGRSSRGRSSRSRRRPSRREPRGRRPSGMPRWPGGSGCGPVRSGPRARSRS